MSMNIAFIKPGKRGPRSVLLGNVGSQIANGWRDYYEVILAALRDLLYIY